MIWRKKMTKKYYIGSVSERNGDMEYDTPYIFETGGDPNRYSDKVAKNWRGDWRGEIEEDKDFGGYWFDGTSLVYDGGNREIPKEDFDVLKKYIYQA